MTTKLRAAIIGPGRIASTYDDEIPNKLSRDFLQGEHRHTGLYTVHPVNHAESYQTVEGYELVGVAGRGQERLQAFSDRWNVPAFENVESMLADARPDVVSICTQSDAKAALTEQVAGSSQGVKAIIVEKAMATSVAEADRMIAACEAAGVLLVVNHPFRYSQTVQEARQLIENGEIGEIGTLSAWSRGGAIHGGTHQFDLMRYFGGDISEVTAKGSDVSLERDSGLNGMLQFTNGIAGFISLERDAAMGFEIRGSHGMIDISPCIGESWKVDVSLLNPDGKRRYPYVGKREPLGASPHEMSTTQRMLAEVREAIVANGAMTSTGRDGAAALECGVASIASAVRREPVSIPLTAELRAISIANR